MSLWCYMLCELQGGDDDGGADLLSQRHISEIYYLWKLAGGDLEGSLRKAGLIRRHPPITQLPSYVLYYPFYWM